MRPIDADALIEEVQDWVDPFVLTFINNAPTVEPNWKFYYDHGYAPAKRDLERSQGECKTCRHRDPEDKKCDCGGQERQGCQFPVSDDYFCKFYEKGGAE